MLIGLTTRNEGDMEYNLPLNGSIDLDALDDYLMSDHARTTVWAYPISMAS
jgi:hypothetical protein